VFPLSPRAKVPPAGSHGHRDATLDQETLRDWWAETPDCNVAIATGEKSGLVVVDVDLRYGGDASLFDLETRFGVPQETPQAETSNGWHLYFSHRGGRLRSGFGAHLPGLDVKAEGGYVVAPPSIHPDGSVYRWKLAPEDTALAELPAGWVELLRRPAGGEEPAARRDTPLLTPGRRHKGLCALAGRLVNAGLGPGALAEALARHNQDHCDPPLPEPEVTRLAGDAVGWEVREPSGDADGVWVDGEFLRSTSFADLGELSADTHWSWKNWIPDSYLTVVAGDTGAGKTWLTLALVQSVLQGGPWPDGQPGPTPGSVFWLEAEQRQSIVRARLRALGLDESRVKVMPDPLRTYYVDRERDFRRIAAMAIHHQPRLMVVDAWSKALAGKENDSEIRFCLDWLQHLARDIAAPILLIHHVRKPQATDWSAGFDFDRLRGSSVLAQVAVSIIGVDQQDRRSEERRVSAGKATLAPLPEPLSFRVQGRVDQGEPVTLHFGPPESDAPTSRLDEARGFLRRALADGPRPAEEVKAAAKEEGLSEETLRTARRMVGLSRRRLGARHQWEWSLREPTLPLDPTG
jgi:hypothetical protein